MTALELLVNTRNLLSDPNKWCKGAWGRDEHGPISILDINEGLGSSFCIWGAMYYVTRHLHPRRAVKIILEAKKALGISKLDEWNDALERVHIDVMTLLDNTIESLRSLNNALTEIEG